MLINLQFVGQAAPKHKNQFRVWITDIPDTQFVFFLPSHLQLSKCFSLKLHSSNLLNTTIFRVNKLTWYLNKQTNKNQSSIEQTPKHYIQLGLCTYVPLHKTTKHNEMEVNPRYRPI